MSTPANSSTTIGSNLVSPTGHDPDILRQSLMPLSLADQSPYRPNFNGPSQQEVSTDPVVADIGATLDYSLLKHLLGTSVNVPATLLLHFQAAFSVPRLMRTSETFGAARATLLLAALESISQEQPSDAQLTRLGALAQSLNLDVSPQDILNTFSNRIEGVITRKASTPVIQYLTAADSDLIDEFDTLRDVPMFSIDSFSNALELLTQLMADLTQLRTPATIFPYMEDRLQADPFLNAIYSLIKIKHGYTLTMIPTTMAHALDGTDLLLPRIERWTGMDRLRPDGATAPGQFKFYEVVPNMSGQVSLLDVTHTLAYIDETIIGIPVLDIDLTSLIDVSIRTGGSRAFIARPNFGELNGRNLLLPDGDISFDTTFQAFNSMITVAVLKQIFSATSQSNTLGKIRTLTSGYRPADDVSPYLHSINMQAEALTAVYAGLMSIRSLLESVVTNHQKFSKRFDNMQPDSVSTVLDSSAIRRYISLRESGFEPFYQVPAMPSSAASLTSPAEISLIPAPFELKMPTDFFVTQESWYQIRANENGDKVITIASIPPPRFKDGKPVILSGKTLDVSPVNVLGNVVGPVLRHEAYAFDSMPYSDLGAQIDFSAMIRLFPINWYLDRVVTQTDSMSKFVSDYIMSQPIRVVDLGITAAQNSFVLRSRSLALQMSAEGFTWNQVMRVFHRFERASESDQFAPREVEIAEYRGHAYDLGADPVIVFKEFPIYIENTEAGTSVMDWFSAKAPLFVTRPFASGAAYPYFIDPILSERPKFVDITATPVESSPQSLSEKGASKPAPKPKGKANVQDESDITASDEAAPKLTTDSSDDAEA